MRVLNGVGVGYGAVIGPVVRGNPVPVVPANAPAPADPEAAADRVLEVFADVASVLEARSAAATGTLSEVLAATAQMARDQALAGQAAERVRGGAHPAVAVAQVTDQFLEMFNAAGGYLAERTTDLASVRDRVIAALEGLPEPGVPPLTVPSVVVAADLTPADTAALDLSLVLGIVVEQGGPTSHTAIIAKQLALPCVVRVTEASELADGDMVAVDAAKGAVSVDPNERVKESVAARRVMLTQLAKDTGDGATSDGHAVKLLANIGTAEDAEKLTDAPVEGVGLFRTEVLFLSAQTAPSEDEQAKAYSRAFAALGDRKVVIRTLDAGADKPLPFVTQPGEENPALGVRGYRLVRVAGDLLTTQLAAIARAAKETGATPWVMAPMISTVDEAAAFAAKARDIGIAKVGVMVEVPAVALRAEDLLGEVDFVSLGTNDLAQYTMATDRLRGELVDLLDMWQPAVLDLAAATAKAGLELGKPVSVCGESASDPLMALVLTGMGVTSLSMAPAAIPMVRFALRSHTLDECRKMAAAARGARTAAEAYRATLALAGPKLKDLV